MIVHPEDSWWTLAKRHPDFMNALMWVALFIFIRTYVYFRPSGKRAWCNGRERTGRLFLATAKPQFFEPKWTMVKTVENIHRNGEIYDLQFNLTLIIDKLEVYASTKPQEMEWELTCLLKEHAFKMEVWQFENIVVAFFNRYGLQVHMETKKHIACNLVQAIKEQIHIFCALEQDFPYQRDLLLRIFPKIY